MANLEQRVRSAHRRLRWGRIAKVTLGYGLIGATLGLPAALLGLTMASGFGLSLYDEVSGKGMNLGYPAAGLFLGGVAGYALSPHLYAAPSAALFGGAAVGEALGTWMAYAKRKTSLPTPQPYAVPAASYSESR